MRRHDEAQAFCESDKELVHVHGQKLVEQRRCNFEIGSVDALCWLLSLFVLDWLTWSGDMMKFAVFACCPLFHPDGEWAVCGPGSGGWPRRRAQRPGIWRGVRERVNVWLVVYEWFGAAVWEPFVFCIYWFLREGADEREWVRYMMRHFVMPCWTPYISGTKYDERHHVERAKDSAAHEMCLGIQYFLFLVPIACNGINQYYKKGPLQINKQKAIRDYKENKKAVWWQRVIMNWITSWVTAKGKNKGIIMDNDPVLTLS